MHAALSIGEHDGHRKNHGQGIHAIEGCLKCLANEAIYRDGLGRGEPRDQQEHDGQHKPKQAAKAADQWHPKPGLALQWQPRPCLPRPPSEARAAPNHPLPGENEDGQPQHAQAHQRSRRAIAIAKPCLEKPRGQRLHREEGHGAVISQALHDDQGAARHQRGPGQGQHHAVESTRRREAQ